MNMRSWTLPLALCCVLHAGTTWAQSARTNPRAEIDFYLQTYGRVPAADVPDVYAVFDKVRSAADKSSLVTAQLVIVGDAKQASAFALSDGTIFLTKRALAIIRESATAEQVQARLAFVLGHELAHLSSNDFWDDQISQALFDTSTAKELTTRQREGVLDTSIGQQKKELKADDLGFVYAALAGYDLDSLLQPTGANEDFLSFWNAKAGKRNDPNYPQPAQRTSMLRARLKEMHDALQYFEFGSRLMHFGRYREAIGFYREFQKQFPGRELFNNLGYCYLRIGVNQLDPDYAYRYWLPMVSDLDTTLAKLTMRSAEGLPDRKHWRISAAARESLLQAARHFEQAIDKDAAYAPSYVNLAVAHLLLGMDASDARLPAVDGNNLLRAKIAVQSALKLQPDDAQTRVLGAIVDYELAFADKSSGRSPPVYSQTSSQLSSQASVDVDVGAAANNPTIVYNLAQLAGNDPVKSASYWQKLAGQFDSLPKKMQTQVCRQRQRAAELRSSCEGLAANSPGAKLPWNLPVKLSRDLLEAPLTESELRQNAWQKNSLNSGTVFTGMNNSALATDDIVTLVVLKRVPATAESLAQCCSQPLEKIPVVNGTLWHYGRWIALFRDRTVEEVWVSN